MKIEAVVKVLEKNDGSLPDINFDFNDEKPIPRAYQYIQNISSELISKGAFYWSKTKQTEIPIKFGENPAIKLIEGEAEPFHVVFGGIKSSSGKSVPDLGVFVLSSNYISLDYRMGAYWNTEAVIGLFEIMLVLESLSKSTIISHQGNIFEQEKELVTAYINWKKI